MLRVSDKRYIKRARVLRIVKDANVGCSRVRRGFVRDYSAGIIIFLEENRVWRCDDQPQAASLGDATRHEQSRCKIASHNFPRFNQFLLPWRFAISQPSQIAPEGDTDAVRQNFVEIGAEIGIRDVQRKPEGELRTTNEGSVSRCRFAVINKSVIANTQSEALINPGRFLAALAVHLLPATQV